MQVYKADVADIQRSVHRDESFINELQENFTTLLKLLGNETYNSFRKFIPVLASSWYYFATSLSNRQTLGEEYAGIVRVVSGSLMPSKVVHYSFFSKSTITSCKSFTVTVNLAPFIFGRRLYV